MPIRTNLNPDGVVIQTKRTNCRYGWMKSRIYKIRSMVSGRFYRDKTSLKKGDTFFIRHHYKKQTHGFTAYPEIGANNLVKLTKGQYKLITYQTGLLVGKNPIFRDKISEISKETWTKIRHNWCISPLGTKKRGKDGLLRRNGVPVVKFRLCQRVPLGAEKLLTEKTGVLRRKMLL